VGERTADQFEPPASHQVRGSALSAKRQKRFYSESLRGVIRTDSVGDPADV